jgi:hypothetical protein
MHGNNKVAFDKPQCPPAARLSIFLILSTFSQYLFFLDFGCVRSTLPGLCNQHPVPPNLMHRYRCIIMML